MILTTYRVEVKNDTLEHSFRGDIYRSDDRDGNCVGFALRLCGRVRSVTAGDANLVSRRSCAVWLRGGGFNSPVRKTAWSRKVSMDKQHIMAPNQAIQFFVCEQA